MSLYRPCFVLEDTGRDGYKVKHNCEGSLNFLAEDVVDEKTARLLQLAFDAGKRARSKELRELLGIERFQ